MKREWRRTESRIIRPFASTNECLSAVRFRILPDAPFEDKASFEIDEPRVQDVRPEVDLKLNRAAKLVSELGEDSLAVTITIRDKRLHRAEQFLETPLADAPEQWILPDSARARFGWNFGVVATVALILKEDRRRTPGRPSNRGQWLDRRVFWIRPIREPHTFPIQSWTPAQFAEQGLPRDSLYWLQLTTTDFNQPIENPSEAFVLAIRDDAFMALAAHDESPAAKAIQALLVSEVMTDVLIAALRSLRHGDEINRRGVLFGLTERVRKATGAEIADLQRFAGDEDDGRARIRTHVQAALATRRSVARYSKGA